MAREPIETELQHHLGGAARPAAFALDVFESLEEAAHVEQKPGEFRADLVKRLAHLLARRDRGFGECRGAGAAMAILRHRGGPVGGDARHHLRAGEISAQPLAGLQLCGFDQRTAIAPFAPREPGQRTLGQVNGDPRTAASGFDVFMRQREVLTGKWVDPGIAARKRRSRQMRASGRCDFKTAVRQAERKIGGNQRVGVGNKRIGAR